MGGIMQKEENDWYFMKGQRVDRKNYSKWY